VVELTAKTPLGDTGPLTIGTVTLSEVDIGQITSVSAYKGQTKPLSAALKTAHGMALPGPNRTTGRADARAIWFGREQMILIGVDADKALADHAALTDQSDAWTVVELKGAGAIDVLARLTPLDLRPSVFKRGHTARTDLMHMASSITRMGEDSYMIMVFRSMADTVLHDLQRAMDGVAARG
jgi:heterotetrameric sarcosine oxidase gamma subunit